MKKKLSRRDFLSKTLSKTGTLMAGASVLGVSSIANAKVCASAIDLEKDKDDKSLMSMVNNVFRYNEADKVDKCSTNKPKGNCGNCQYYVACEEDASCGICQLFQSLNKKIVKKDYCCNSFQYIAGPVPTKACSV